MPLQRLVRFLINQCKKQVRNCKKGGLHGISERGGPRRPSCRLP